MHPVVSSEVITAPQKRKSDAMDNAKNDKLFPKDRLEIFEDDPVYMRSSQTPILSGTRFRSV